MESVTISAHSFRLSLPFPMAIPIFEAFKSSMSLSPSPIETTSEKSIPRFYSKIFTPVCFHTDYELISTRASFHLRIRILFRSAESIRILSYLLPAKIHRQFPGIYLFSSF